MKWFYDLRIAMKPTASFVIVFALTVFLGVFSIVQLAMVNQTATDMENVWLPSMRAVLQIKADMARFHAIELQYMNASGDADLANYEKAVLAISADLKEDQQQYAKRISDPAEKEVFERFQNRFAAYIGQQEKIFALIHEQKNWEVPALLKNEMLTGGRKQLNDDVGALIRMNENGNMRAVQAGAAVYLWSRIWIVGLLAVSIVLGLGLALSVARIVPNPLALRRASPERWRTAI